MSADGSVHVSLRLEARTQPVVGEVTLECGGHSFSGWIELFSILHALVDPADAAAASTFVEGEK